jgi:amino acid transporter
MVLYCLVAASLTLMVNYTAIDVDAPLSQAFAQHGADWAQIVVAVGSLAALFTTVLTSYIAQSRIFFAMARDGLLPSVFAKVNQKTQTPVLNTIVVGVIAAGFAGFTSLDFLGLGVPPSTASLGELLAQGKANLDAWWITLSTFAVLVGTLMLLIFIGEALRTALDTRRG